MLGREIVIGKTDSQRADGAEKSAITMPVNGSRSSQVKTNPCATQSW
jgi:hypothetical protein